MTLKMNVYDAWFSYKRPTIILVLKFKESIV